MDEDAVTIKSVEVCCAQDDEKYKGSNIIKNDSSFWHTRWTYDKDHKKHSGKHWIKVTFDKAYSISGFEYTPRSYQGNGDQNGKIQKFNITLYDENGNIKLDEEGTFKYEGGYTDSQKKTYPFKDDKTYTGITSAKIEIESAYSSDDGEHASGVYLGFFNNMQIIPTVMTASEYVGHIDDINSKYDMIYIGDDDTNRNRFINGDSPMMYTHVGAGISMAEGLSGLTDVNPEVAGKAGLDRLMGQLNNDFAQGTWSDGKKRLASVSTYSENGAGYFRGSGNDITNQQYQELMEFVKSGYPVVLGEKLVNVKGKNRTVNMDTVDGSSYYYQFLQDALKYSNVIVESELKTSGKNLSFYMNLAKPVINFSEKPLEAPRAEWTTQPEESGYINEELKYTFTVENDSEIAPANTTYDCKLYLDLNFDGNLSDKEVQDKYMTVQDVDGNVLTQISDGESSRHYELKLGKQYTITRKIPKDYFKLITWKLEISNNSNPYIHTSVQGYAKQKNQGGEDNRQTINVLQLLPANDKDNPYGTWRLKTHKRFNKLLEAVEDFDIQISEVSVPDFKESDLDGKQILIIGFDDAYEDIPNADAIKRFIESGRSVIFSHDTTSYQYFAYSDVYNKVAQTEYGKDEVGTIRRDGWLIDTHKNERWGISLNNIVRSIVGMDRYGITNTNALINGQTVSDILKQGHELSDSEISFTELRNAVGDIAYKKNDTSRTTSYAQTQAYTNGLLQRLNYGSSSSGALTTSAQKVNDGAITQYPFQLKSGITIAKTHAQYFQLALEEDKDLLGNSDDKNDIVVWYCLSNQTLYNNSPNDARNYYYYYSKGNVIYTGSGHSAIAGEDSEGTSWNDDEIKLFINSIVAAANVTAVQAEVHFVKSLNPTAETEQTRYYMTDQKMWTVGERNTLEKDMDFYLNIKDYNMVSADLSQKDLDEQEMTLQFYITDDKNGEVLEQTSEELSSASAPDKNKVKNISGEIPYLREYGDDKTVIERGSDNMFHIKRNNAYGFELADIENYLRNEEGYTNNCKIYVKVITKVSLYGQPTQKTSWACINLKQRQLFDLD